ncbi:MAG: YncE family protein [Myxococcota bacterium]
MKCSRPELLLCALYTGVMGFCPIVYAPTSKLVDTVMGLSLWALALLCVVVALRPRPAAPDPRAAVRYTVNTLKAAIGVGVLGVSLWMHAYGYLMAFIMAQPVAITMAILEVLTLLTCFGLAWRRPHLRPWTMGIGATLLFIGSFQFVVLAAWVYSPPAPEVCEEIIQEGVVERLSPGAWASEPSQPYMVRYLPDKGWVVATFKMGGNGSFGVWDNPTSNRLVVVDVRDPTTVAVAPLGDDRVAVHLGYRAATDDVLVSRQGGTTHALDVVSLKGFPDLKKVQSVAVENAPHHIMPHPDGQRYAVLSEHGDVGVFDGATLVEGDRHFLGLLPDHVPAPLYGWNAPETSTMYVSVLVYPLVKVDVDTGEAVWSRRMYGGGHVVGHPPTSEVVVTDMLMNRVAVLGAEDLVERRSIDLDYTPRSLEMDTKRDLLMVGGWFTGEVNFYRLSTLEPLGVSVQVGSTLRDLSMDSERGLLFAASKCGLHQVRLAPLLAQALSP